MGIVHGEIAGAPVLICRLSFSGEMAFEVYCGAGHGTHVWEALIEAGKPFGMVPYGLEALGTLRIEKGHVTGAEIDGRTTAHDLHLDWMLSKKKPFVGSNMHGREGLVAEDRISLVGVDLARQSPAERRRACRGSALTRRTPAIRSATSRPCAIRRRSANTSALALVQRRQVAARHARLHLRPAARPLRPGRDRQSSFLRSSREPHAWLICCRRLQPVLRPGSHGNFADGVGVALSEVQPGSIVQVAAWPGHEKAVIAAIQAVTGLAVPDGAGGGVMLDGKVGLRLRARKVPVVASDEDGLG